MQRYRQTPKGREVMLESRRKYYEEAGAYVRSYQRRYEQANREKVNARRRRWYAERKQAA